jgi:hypothetical protein
MWKQVAQTSIAELLLAGKTSWLLPFSYQGFHLCLECERRLAGLLGDLSWRKEYRWQSYLLGWHLC